jgi:hypothetical protein
VQGIGDTITDILAFMNRDELLDAIYERSELFTKNSFWIFGGDGGPMISAMAGWTMFWPLAKTSTFW